MRNHNRCSRLRFFLTAIVFGVALVWHAPAQAQEKKLTVEDLISRHLASIGTPEARAAVKNRAVGGPLEFTIRIGGGGTLRGTGVLLSAENKVRGNFTFSTPDYPGDTMAFNGERAAVGMMTGGKRSTLSQFLHQQVLPLKEGLFGGVLSTAWPLLRVEQQKPRLEYRGVKEVEGKRAHSLSYRAGKGSSELKVTLYFELETFRHIGSRYEFEIGARLGIGPNDSTRVQESNYILTESFADFGTSDGLTLPTKYKLQMSVQTSGGSLLHEWMFTVAQISHKEPFTDQVFTIK